MKSAAAQRKHSCIWYVCTIYITINTDRIHDCTIKMMLNIWRNVFYVGTYLHTYIHTCSIRTPMGVNVACRICPYLLLHACILPTCALLCAVLFPAAGWSRPKAEGCRWHDSCARCRPDGTHRLPIISGEQHYTLAYLSPYIALLSLEPL